MKRSEEEHLFKIMVLGSSGAGKTCFIRKFVNHIYIEEHKPTEGVSFALKELTIFDTREYSTIRHKIHFQFWEVAETELCGARALQLYRESRAAIVIFDVNDPESLQQAKFWINNYHTLHTKGSEGVIPIFLIANKIDLNPRHSYTSIKKLDLDDETLIEGRYLTISTREDDQVSALLNDLASKLLVQEIAQDSYFDDQAYKRLSGCYLS